MTKKRIDLGEYVITIYHNSEDEKLEVKVFDEGGDILEAIIITGEDEEEEIDEPEIFNLN